MCEGSIVSVLGRGKATAVQRQLGYGVSDSYKVQSQELKVSLWKVRLH